MVSKGQIACCGTRMSNSILGGAMKTLEQACTGNSNTAAKHKLQMLAKKQAHVCDRYISEGP